MKKIFLIALGILIASLAANAQIADTAAAKSIAEGNVSLNDVNYASLLHNQNKLLKNRNTALIITTSGIGSAALGVTLFNASGSQAGPVFYVAGLIAGTTGAVWMIVNEFKLIKNQRAINDMKLEAIPGGIALKF